MSTTSDGICCNDHAQTPDVVSSSVQGWQQGQLHARPWEKENLPAKYGHEYNDWNDSSSTWQQYLAEELDEWEEKAERETYLAGESDWIHRDLFDSDTLDSYLEEECSADKNLYEAYLEYQEARDTLNQVRWGRGFCTVRLHTSAHLHVCHTRMAQVPWNRCWSHAHVVLHLAVPVSDLSYPLLLLHGHFETTPDYDLADSDIHEMLPYFPVLEAQDTCNSAPASRSLATWPSQIANTVYEPKEFDKTTSVDNDTMLINGPNHNFSDFSKTSNEDTRQFGVPTVFESSVSQRSHDDFALQVESKESMQSWNRCWT